MRALMIGYGKMGREIEESLRQRNHSVCAVVDPYIYAKDDARPSAGGGTTADQPPIFDELAATDDIAIDVAIDFSTADSFLKNYTHYAERGMSVIVGTTGWYNHFDEVSAAFKNGGGRCVYGTNFSIGAQMFLQLIDRATELLGITDAYDFMVTEMHHKQKTDSPSGTAKSVANRIVSRHPRKRRVVHEPLQRAIEDDELHLASVRGGSIPGIHTLTIDSVFDTITVSHSARTRQGFALGAVLAAEWIANNDGIHNIEDIIESVVTGANR